MCYGRVIKHKKKGRLERLVTEVVFGELPKTSTGKIQKYLLRERAKSTHAIE